MDRRVAACWLIAGLAIAVGPAYSQNTPSPEKAAEFFEKSIRPVLVENCLGCHNADKHKAGLRLDSRQALLRGGESGPAIVPGHSDKSLLVKALSYKDDELRMPPKGPLQHETVDRFVLWINEGAFWPDSGKEVRPVASEAEFKITAADRAFWSFKPIANPSVPKVKNQAWPQTTIDRFILARLEEKQLRPVESADRHTLLRRATFDLTGLPPTSAEIEAFVNDTGPDSFDRVIERLLASPHYGERWARHWLDVARYGEDRFPHSFRYRDWLIQAFNADMPYDRFIQEQVAADLLDLPDRNENLAALGFLTLSPFNGGGPKGYAQLEDRIDTLSRGFLGLTVACARCHDHKFDPISTTEYYGLAGIFASTSNVEVPLVSAEEAKALGAEKKLPPGIPRVHAAKDGQPVTMKVLIRGNPETLGNEAPRGFLSILSAAERRLFTQGSGRLELAQAIADPHNPLTARVMVNRIWKHHFGQGLVRTPSNFGKLGDPPTHPELLDHLATRFIATGWSIKDLHRAILGSAVYQLASCGDTRNEEVDADNKLLWRMNRRRLEVEAWRDGMLAVAGTLDRSLGGRSNDLANPENRRRTLYGSVSRDHLDSLLRLFDFPDPNITSDSRTVTTVPLQQLFVLNSPFMVRNAKALAEHLTAGEKEDSRRIQQAFFLLYGRPVTEPELRLGLEFLQGSDEPGVTLTRWQQYAQVLLGANEFMFVD